jgi:hypothetical protein
VTFENGLTDYGEIRPGTFQERRFSFSDGLFRATEVNEVPVASAPTSALG